MKSTAEIFKEKELLYRRQFILSPRYNDGFPMLKIYSVGDESLCLQVHPSLKVTQISRGDMELTLLGYVLGPDNPADNDEEILNRLLEQMGSVYDAFEHTIRLGGRWILIVIKGSQRILFADATGLRAVTYTDGTCDGTWCASQPGIIGEIFGLAVDGDLSKLFADMTENAKVHEYWWPGDITPFRKVKTLLPNHFLDLRKGKSRRYWPQKRVKNLSLEDGINYGSGLLTNLILSAHNRFKLALGITAGWDTRLLLAASRDICHDIYYHTSAHYGLTEESPDIRIPGNLLSKMGLNHHIINVPSEIDSKFERIYMRNVFGAHPEWGKICQGLFDQYPGDRVCMRGVVSSQITKRDFAYYKVPSNQKFLNGEVLADLSFHFRRMKKNPVITGLFQRWLDEIYRITDLSNIHPIELFGWEQETGNWQAMSQLESDIVYEVFSPYNCRALLETFLGVERKFRRPPKQELYRGLIMSLWPELLSEPINPLPLGKKIKDSIKPLLTFSALYLALDHIFMVIQELARYWSKKGGTKYQ